jgi:hypothetical protein
MTDHELPAAAARLNDLQARRVAHLEHALAESWQVARLLAHDLLELAALLPPDDLLEAEAMAGAVRRARLVLARFGDGGSH